MVSATLIPSYDEPALTLAIVNIWLQEAGYGDYFRDEDAIEELLVHDQTLREQGQKVLEVSLKKLREKLAAEAKADASADPDSHPAATPEPSAMIGQDETLNIPAEKIFAMLGKERVTLTIAEQRDGRVEIGLSENELSAELTLLRPFGGRAMERKDIETAISKAKIQSEIIPGSIEQALELGECSKLPLALGIEPRRGHDSAFEALVVSLQYSGPNIDEKGIADFHNIMEFVVVEPGTPLMRRHPPGRGKNGSNIFGQAILAEPGEILPFFGGIEGTKVSETDPNLLVAAIKGHPIIHDRGVSVDTVLMLKNASLATGNIDFDGSVCIAEDVADGITVKASGDVTVLGVVGKATIQAGGSVAIKQGLIGGSKTGEQSDGEDKRSAFVQAQGSVSAKFASGADISAGDQINIDEYASHCVMTAASKILLGQKRGKGQLIGGRTEAFDLVWAKILGSTGGATTEIKVGAEADAIVKLRSISSELKQLQEDLSERIDTVRKLSIRAKVAGLNPQTRELIEKNRAEQEKLQARIVFLREQEEQLKKLLVRSKKSRVQGAHKIHHNVCVSILGASHRFKDEINGGSLSFEARSIQLKR